MTPLTVFGGYLGSGKTTAINSMIGRGLLRDAAVIVNDLSALNVDVDLIKEHDGLTVALQNGCVCCSITSSLDDTLENLLRRSPRVGWVVIEGSGVADPGKIAMYGRGWPGYRLDSTIVMVDASSFVEKVEDKYIGDLIVRQLRSADYIFVSKRDLISDSECKRVISLIRDRTGNADVMMADYGLLSSDIVLPAEYLGIDVERDRRVSQFHLRSRPDPAFLTVEFTETRSLNRTKFESIMSRFSPHLERAKGFVRFEDDGRGYVVQLSGAQWAITEHTTGSESATVVRLAFIARKHKAELLSDLQHLLRSAIAI